MQKKAVLFDFWGTIIENGVFPSPVKQAKFILRLRVPFVDYIQKFENAFMTQRFENLSDGFQNVVKAFNTNAPPFVIEKLVGMWNKNTLLAKPFDDTIEAIKELKAKGVKVCIVANTDPFSVNQVLDKFELRDLFDEIFLSYEEGMLKTDPQLFEVICARLGLNKEDLIMVGDSMQSDIKAAQNAEIMPILIDRRNKRDFDNKVKNLFEIKNFLDDNLEDLEKEN
jgi:HAD superfamily hydrolase (TIGR01493 family)